MKTAIQLETVLRYAYLHGFTAEQWIEPTKECLEAGNLDTELCELLLKFIFSFTRVSVPLLESYLTLATTGKPTIENNASTAQIDAESIVPPIVFISQLVPLGELTAHSHPHQWSYLLKLLPTLLGSFNTDKVVSDLQNGQENEWVDILSNVFQLLSHIVAVGLYPDWYSKSTTPAFSPATLTSAISFHNNNTQTGFDSQFSFQSQHSINFDADATMDIDNTQRMEDEDEDLLNTSYPDAKPNQSNGDIEMKDMLSNESSDKRGIRKMIEIENAAMAAQIMIHLIEKRGAKRLFEVRNNQRRQADETVSLEHEPWVQCQAKLEPKNILIKECLSSVASQNTHIQKLLQLIQRLTDRDLERRMAVHMKYHELEDEGTARAMPSAGLMGLLYHMVQIRPSLDDEYIIDHLLKLQTIKGSFDESFYLELWLTALTGLREASLNTSCQSHPNNDNDTSNQEKNCNAVVATNRLLWKSLVLVKLPFLLSKLQKKKEEIGDHTMDRSVDENEFNPYEASLRELKAFTGLVNACSPPACCPEFYAPDSMSSMLVDKIAFGEEDDDDDDIMKMINDISYTSDLNTPLVTKSIRSISNNDIFTNIVTVCERYGFIRPKISAELLTKKDSTSENMMDLEEDSEKLTPVIAIDQNIDLRFEALRNSVSFTALTELLHIGLVSPIHLRKIMDFLLNMLREKSALNDFYALSKICDAFTKCPCSVDLILQLYTPFELLGPLENICNNWSPSDNEMNTEDQSTTRTTEGEEELDGVQLLYNKFGKIWNLTVSVVRRFKLYREMNTVFQNKFGFLYQYFTQGPMIYGVDIEDDSIEPFINRWMDALAGGDGLSDDLLRTSKIQNLLMVVPTIIQRSICLYSTGQMQEDVFIGMISYFQKPFLDFALSSIFPILCDELLGGQSAIALTCLRQLIISEIALSREISLHPVLGSLESLLEFKRQESAFLTKEEEEKNVALVNGMSELAQFIMTNNRMDKLTEDHSLLHIETVTTGVTPNTLFEKATLMFKYIVKSGRSMFMSDVDADTNALWDDNAPSKMQVVSHYLDMVLFETALEIGGGRWFVSMIVDQVLEAGKCGGAVRAAELGSCLIATPLLYSVNRHNSCVNLLRCLLQDVLPSTLYECAEQNMSFFQGQTLGVFTSDVLVLMQDRYSSVNRLGKWFFEALVVDRENEQNKKHRLNDELQVSEGTRFAEWDDNVTKSAVWRGFIKGLMSNPMIEEVWPHAFI